MLREAETQSYNLTVFVYGKQADILLLLALSSLFTCTLPSLEHTGTIYLFHSLSSSYILTINS